MTHYHDILTEIQGNHVLPTLQTIIDTTDDWDRIDAALAVLVDWIVRGVNVPPRIADNIQIYHAFDYLTKLHADRDDDLGRAAFAALEAIDEGLNG